MLSACGSCGTALVAGPTQERSAHSAQFEVTVRGVPSRVCPRGCPGHYGQWPTLSMECIALLRSLSGHLARRKLGFFRVRLLCPHCGAELTDRGRRNTFAARGATEGGQPIELSVVARCLTCPRCELDVMPGQTAASGEYYRELAETISEAATRDLIWK